jgi:hypothetical protein
LTPTRLTPLGGNAVLDLLTAQVIEDDAKVMLLTSR